MRHVGLQCPTCGAWFMFADRERHHRDGHAAEMMLTGPAKRAAYEEGRRLWREQFPPLRVIDGRTRSI